MARRFETKPLARPPSTTCRSASGGWTTDCWPWSCRVRHVPIVVCDLYYPVGSFDEPPGRTGAGPLC